MRLSTIATGNVRRHLPRALLLTAVIALTVAVVATLFLVNAAAERDLANQVDEYGANIIVTPRTEELPLSYGGVDLGDTAVSVEPLHLSDVETVRSIEESRNINIVSPKIVETARIDGADALVVGVWWEEELTLKPWWNISGAEPAGPRDALAGSRAAELLGLTPGDTVSVRGGEVEVTGVLAETGGSEDDVLFMDLGTVQDWWDRGDEISFIEVAAYCSTCPIETINAQIAAEMPDSRVSAVLKAAESREILIGQFRLFSVVLSVLMVGVGGLIIFATTLGSVRERRAEIGVFRAIGYRRRHIFSVILLENVGLSLVGAAAGAVVALLAVGWVAGRVAGVEGSVDPDLTTLATVVLLSPLVVVIAGAYPAFQASRLSPTLAMREV